MVVIEKENILDLAKALGCKDEKSIKDIQKRIQLNQIADMILMALDSDEDTLTAHLINEFGSMDNIFFYFSIKNILYRFYFVQGICWCWTIYIRVVHIVFH